VKDELFPTGHSVNIFLDALKSNLLVIEISYGFYEEKKLCG